MARLVISRKEQQLIRLFPAYVYSDQGKLGQLKAGDTEEFFVDEKTQVIHVRNILQGSQKIMVNAKADETCIFNVYTHPATRLIRLSLFTSILFFSVFLLFFIHLFSWVITTLFLVPIIILIVVGLIFCSSNYFVIQEEQ